MLFLKSGSKPIEQEVHLLKGPKYKSWHSGILQL